MTTELEAKIEHRAMKALGRVPEIKSEEGISPDDPEIDRKQLDQLRAIYSDLRALLRVTPGDNIADHYYRIYKLGKQR